MRFLALDVGARRVGVARGDDQTRIAVPVGWLENNASLWLKLAQIANQVGANHIIVGLPRSNAGVETAQSAYAREFARTLTQQLPGVMIKFQDESLTSVEAEERLKASGRPYQKGDIDAEAAAIILQDFLEGGGQPRRTITGVDSLSSYSAAYDTGVDVYDNTLDGGFNSPPSPQPPQNVSTAVTPPEQEQNMSKKHRKAKKAKKSKKSKNSKKGPSIGSIISGLVTLLIIAGVGAGGLLYARGVIREERAEEYARQEREMNEKAFDFTIKPGETLADIRENLVAAGYSETEADAALAADYDYDFLRKRPAGSTLEGYLFGETKNFYADTPATEVIDFFLGQMQQTIEENNLEQKYAAQGLSLHEGVILASIVQKEAATPDMPTVAQVFLRRLDEDIPLGSDVTVSYGLDMVDPGRDSTLNNQEALATDSCYNTRMHKGLPCGPISNPGVDALLAVANPSPTDYLFFLTGDDHLMYYSYTEEEHTQNAAEHCQTLCQVSL